MALSRRIFKLNGVIQHYAWGGFDFIPQLLGVENEAKKPFAEYWMGAHPNHPATIGDEIELSDFIKGNASGVLGNAVAEKFSTLPYLFKVLDVFHMLSIQVHPSKQAAEAAFEEENRKGISLTAPHRNYRDGNHKPELMVALSDFYLLHGFRSERDLHDILQSKKELHFLLELFQSGGYKAVYEEVMLMEQRKVNEILHPLVQKILPQYRNGSLKKTNEDFWAARAALRFCQDNNYDRGIFSIYLLNLVQLRKGEGIFQPAGMPHAYLEGQNVEIMANSDNVLRAGLTDKHINVEELLKHVIFEATAPAVLNPSSSHRVFASPAEEFQLEQFHLQKDSMELINTTTAEIFLLLEGALQLQAGSEEMEVFKGDSIFVIAQTPLSIKALSDLDLFRATLP